MGIMGWKICYNIAGFQKQRRIVEDTNIENFEQYLCVDEESPLLKE